MTDISPMRQYKFPFPTTLMNFKKSRVLIIHKHNHAFSPQPPTVVESDMNQCKVLARRKYSEYREWDKMFLLLPVDGF